MAARTSAIGASVTFTDGCLSAVRRGRVCRFRATLALLRDFLAGDWTDGRATTGGGVYVALRGGEYAGVRVRDAGAGRDTLTAALGFATTRAGGW
jgi:hypothetical protein